MDKEKRNELELWVCVEPSAFVSASTVRKGIGFEILWRL